MKLRFYMRGLGIGIIVTALILGIGSPQKNTADDADAQMSEAGTIDSQAVVLSDLKENKTSEPTAVQTPGADTEVKTSEPTGAVENDNTPKDTSDPEQSEDNISVRTEGTIVIFAIEHGAGSEAVSKKLEEAGLIESASSFNRFLCDNGYSKSIRAGEYEIPVGAEEEEIVGIITGK